MAIKDRDALSRYAEKEQQLLGESKAEQQVAASLRLRELALRTGVRLMGGWDGRCCEFLVVLFWKCWERSWQETLGGVVLF